MFGFRKVIRQKTALSFTTTFLIITVLSSGITGCANMSPRTKAAIYCGVGGAVVGALAGVLIDKNKARGALIGGFTGLALGAGACFVIKTYLNKEVANYQQTKKETGYTSSSGDVVKITDFYISPDSVHPGEQIQFKSQYYVMAPNSDADLTVTETRVIKLYDEQSGDYKEQGNYSGQVTIKPGTRNSETGIGMNRYTIPGKYRVALIVEYNGHKDEKEYPLTVLAGEPTFQAKEGNKGITGESPTGKYFVISASTANLRSGPGTNFQVLNQLKNGERYPILETVQKQNGSWYRIRLDDGREGWIGSTAGRRE